MGSDEQSLSIRVGSCTYSKNAILSTAYNYSEAFFVSVDQENDTWIIELRPRNHDVWNPVDIRYHFLGDLVEHQLRHDLDTSFHPIREMIVSKAFGKTD